MFADWKMPFNGVPDIQMKKTRWRQNEHGREDKWGSKKTEIGNWDVGIDEKKKKVIYREQNKVQ